jgi:hypothetical protein
MLLEDKHPNRRVSDCLLCFTECDGMLAVHVLYVVHGWKSRPSRSLKNRKTANHHYQTSCSVHYENSNSIPVGFRLCTTRRICKTCILSTDFQQSVGDLAFTARFYSRTHASLGLAWPTFAAKFCDLKKILMQLAQAVDHSGRAI